MSAAEPTVRDAPPVTLEDGTVLRPLTERAEMEACVELQRTVWGEGFSDLASPAILKIVQSLGGVAAGAFGAAGPMLGFVFGITGIRGRRPLHWSHMLAVLPEARGRDLGFHLKAYQRRLLLPLEVETVEWTYDPLVSKNAYLNLVRLGARPIRYLRDYYGTGQDSTLSAGIGTDRFLVEWPIRETRVERILAREEARVGGRAPAAGSGRAAGEADRAELDAAPVVNVRPSAAGGAGRVEPVVADPPEEPVLRVEIPNDVQRVRQESPEEASRWRASTRRALEACLKRGYLVETFYRRGGTSGADRPRSFYVLSRGR